MGNRISRSRLEVHLTSDPECTICNGTGVVQRDVQQTFGMVRTAVLCWCVESHPTPVLVDESA